MKFKIVLTVLALIILIGITYSLINFKKEKLENLEENTAVTSEMGQYDYDYIKLDNDDTFGYCYSADCYWVDSIINPQDVIEFPSSLDNNILTGIEAHAFEHNQTLKKVIIPYGYTVNKLSFSNSSVEEVEIGDYCEIQQYAFANCPNLEKITYTGISHEIWFNAFSDCPNLKEVNLTEGLNFIDSGTFANCPNLTEIKIPLSVEEICEGAFENTPLTKIIGYQDSYAQQYAKEHGIDFEIIG